METRHPLPDVIRRRKSVRTYREEPVPGALLESFRQALSAARRGPLGSCCRFALFDLRGGAGGAPSRLGTYGMIRGARLFFSGAVRRAAYDLEDFGYLFETLVLKATDLGLGTCWLGASFDRSGCARLLAAGPDERVPAASPLGLAAGSPRPLETVVRLAAGSRQRKDAAALFFEGDFAHILRPEEAGPAGLCLEMVRLAPSSRNRQPWRIVREGKRFHFFLQRTLPALGALDLARVDLGIALCHFDLTARHLGLAGGFRAEDPPPASAGPLAPRYVITWKEEYS